MTPKRRFILYLQGMKLLGGPEVTAPFDQRHLMNRKR